MKVSLLLLVLLASGFIGQPVSVAQNATETPAKEPDAFRQENNQKRAQNPDGLLFTAAFKDNQKQFHPGETLKLELSFAASTPKTYALDNASYDRSGRLEIDTFVVDRPDSVVDPLYDYFHSVFFGFMGGGLHGIGEITNKPQLITAELNEWMRFDKPGRYRLYVVSHRVGKMKKGGDPYHSSGVVAVSNVVEFEILPFDKKWATQKLNEALTVLSKPDVDHHPSCRTLRFLGTTAAASEMIKRFRGDDLACEFELGFGLIGSPQRDYVIREMESVLSSPQQPVSSRFVSTLALLKVARQRPPLPPYPDGNEEQIKLWNAQFKEQRSAYEQLQLDYVRQLLTAVPSKEPRARAAALQTLIDYDWLLSAEDFAQARGLFASLSEVFTRLPLTAQIRLLESRWKAFAGPAMLPVLRAILKEPGTDRAQYDQKELRTIALTRLAELSPDEGRRIILDEIRHPTLRMNASVLRSLPDETLPEFDNLLATKLEETRGPNATGDTDVITTLIERYATDSILPRVKAVFDVPGVGKWSCSPQADLLAYFLRVDPASGGEYLNKAVAARGEGFSRCYTFVLVQVAQRHMSREIEDAALLSLDDDDTEVVAQAARILQEHGGADAESALWRRMEKLNEATQNQPSIEQSLVAALTKSQGWVATPEKLKRLLALCRGEGSRHEVEQLIATWRPDIYVTFNASDGEPVSMVVGHYQVNSVDALKQKLLQFPSGTVFRWSAMALGRSGPKAQQLFDEMKSYVEQHGMKLERVSEPVDQ